MNYDFTDKAVLVTGAGSGIGRAIALAFAENSANVVVADVNESAAAETVTLIQKQNGRAQHVGVNVSDSEYVKAMVDFTLSTYGRLDIACNNAGIPPEPKSLVDYTEDDWDKLMNINLKGMWLCMKYEIPELLKQSEPAIINTSSIAGVTGQPGPHYVAAKHGVVGLTKSAALEYAKTGLRINAICPGITKTAILDGLDEVIEQISATIPMGRLATTEEIANAVLWLSSPAASYVTGSTMLVDGGYSVP